MCSIIHTTLIFLPAAIRRRSMGHNTAQQSELQQRFIDLFTSFNDLLEYLQINREVRNNAFIVFFPAQPGSVQHIASVVSAQPGSADVSHLLTVLCLLTHYTHSHIQPNDTQHSQHRPVCVHNRTGLSQSHQEARQADTSESTHADTHIYTRNRVSARSSRSTTNSRPPA